MSTILNTPEAGFLHKVVLDKNLKNYFESQARGVSEDYFEDEPTKLVWNFIHNYISQYREIPDLRTVQEQVPTFIPPEVPERYEYYRDRLIEQYQKIAVSRFSLEIANRVQRHDNISHTLDYIGRTYQELIKGAKIADFGRFRDMMDRIQEVQRRRGAGEEAMGIITGIPELDNHFLGFRHGDYAVLSGRPGEGKTTVALFMAFSAFMSGHNVTYVGLEMPREQLFEKLDALATDISVNKIRRFNLNEEEIEKYKQRAQELFNDNPKDIHIHDRIGDCSLVTIEALINQDEPDIIFIDPIYLMSNPKGFKDWQAIKENSNRLKQLAMKYRRPIVVLSQINRDGAERIRQGEDPSLENLAGSDALGQDADHAFMLTSNNKTRFYKAKRFTATKLRGSATKDIVIKWEPKTNYIAYMEEYKRLQMPTQEMQNIQEAQENYSSGPFNA